MVDGGLSIYTMFVAEARSRLGTSAIRCEAEREKSLVGGDEVDALFFCVPSGGQSRDIWISSYNNDDHLLQKFWARPQH